MNNVKSETHGVGFFKIYDKPKEFVNGGNYKTVVEPNKDLKYVDDKCYFIVSIMATQSIDNVQALAVIHTISEYELITPPEHNIVPMDLWKPLTFKSVEECNKLYKEKVKGTYLEGTDIPAPTIQELGG